MPSFLQELQRLAQRVKTLETQTSAGVDVSKIATLEVQVKSLETQDLIHFDQN